MELRKFTAAEMNTLSRYEYNLECARSNYLRSVGRAGQEELRKIYEDVVGKPFKRTDTCGVCETELLRFLAERYFAQKAEPAKNVKSTTKKGGKSAKNNAV